MRILMLCDGMDIGGAETHIVTLTAELIKRGCEVSVISAGGAYVKSLLKYGARCVYAPTDKRDPAAVIKCKQIIGEEMQKHDTVHAHTRFTAYIARAVRHGSQYPPIAFTAHLAFPTVPYGKISFWGDRTLTVSRDIADHLIKNYGISEKNIDLTLNGINAEVFTNRQKKREKLIVHVSRIDRGRSLTAFLLARIAPLLLFENPEYRIMIVGDGNDFNRLYGIAKHANELLGYDGVLLAGARTDIPSILSSAEIFIGASRAALEAAAIGIATVICGDEGYGGILSRDTFDQLAKTNFCARGLPAADEETVLYDLKKLISAPELCRTTAEECRERVLREYTPLRMADDALKCYEAIKKPTRVCLMGYFGYSNLGDEVTLGAAKAALLKIGISSISVIAAGRGGTDGEVRFFNRSSPIQLIEAIRGCDAFVLCGGNLLQNETSERSLIYYEWLIRTARALGKRVYMLSSGFGEVRGARGGALVKRGIKAALFCGCRTSYDLRVARLLGAKTAYLMPDLCFLLYNGQPKNTRSSRKCFAYIPKRRGELSAEQLLQIGTACGMVPIVIFLYQGQDGENCHKYTDLGISCYFPKSYEHIRTLLCTCAFSVTERLHGAVFSMLTHTPCYTLGSSLKLRALTAEVGSRAKGILVPIDSCAPDKIKEIGACDSDFLRVITDFKNQIEICMREAFGDGITPAF